MPFQVNSAYIREMIRFVLLILPLFSECSEIASFRRIVGGYEAHIEDHPYVVSIQVFKKHICGGSIIKEDVIVTAAHCSLMSFQYRIRAGTDDLLIGGVERKVDRIIIHPDYDDDKVVFDLALMKLEIPLQYIPGKIQKVKLPEYSETVPLVWGTVMGWGETYNKRETMNRLRALNLEIYRTEVCEAIQDYNITEAMFCAGHISGRKDSCNGDSGGPFVIDDTLYGVVSFGTPKCAIGLPGVYTKIPFLVEWIKKTANITD